MAIQVRAIALGYYGHLRNPGDKFMIKSMKEFSENWMERLGAGSARPRRRAVAPPPEVAEEETETDDEPDEVGEES